TCCGSNTAREPAEGCAVCDFTDPPLSPCQPAEHRQPARFGVVLLPDPVRHRRLHADAPHERTDCGAAAPGADLGCVRQILLEWHARVDAWVRANAVAALRPPAGRHRYALWPDAPLR